MFVAVLISTVIATTDADGGDFSAYKTLDSDTDGYISQKKGIALPIFAKVWRSVDMNENGQLDTAEYARFATALEHSMAGPEKAPTEE